MNTPTLVNNMDEYLDILGQQSLLNIYTQICLCFPVGDASSHPAIISRLTEALERLSVSFPWVTGQVVNEGASEGNTGIFKIKPLEKIPQLVVKDLRNDPSVPTMDALRQAAFPFSMLDESIIAPRNTLPETSSEPEPASTPVFLLQANFIDGGLLLAFLGHHQVMDMTGQGSIMDLLSKACRNEPFTPEELSTGNLSRRNIIPFLDDASDQAPDVTRYQPNPTPPTDSSAPPKCTWAYFTFSLASLTALKSLATQTVSSGYISTDDALSALFWQSILRARLPRLDPTTTSTFARAVNVRRYLAIPETYPGLVQNMTFTTFTLQELVNASLGVIASQLRVAVDPKTSSLAHDTRAMATYMDRAADKNSISFVAALDLSKDVMFSSWTKVDCYEMDFGDEIGMPEAVRRPRFTEVESLGYAMPKRKDGEVAVGFSLRAEDMERLKGDAAFMEFAKFIG